MQYNFSVAFAIKSIGANTMEPEFIPVAEFDSESEAMLAKAVLEENQIQVTLSGLEPSALGISLDGADLIELFVSEADVERARPLLDSLANDQPDEVPAWNCQCGEQVDEGFAVCWSCGTEYQPDAS